MTCWATSRRRSRSRRRLTFSQIRERTGAAPAFVGAGLCRLASLGQVIHDLHAGLYRWRQVMPVALSLEELGPESPETVAGRRAVRAVHGAGSPR